MESGRTNVLGGVNDGLRGGVVAGGSIEPLVFSFAPVIWALDVVLRMVSCPSFVSIVRPTYWLP